jgi:serine/threonine protein kinase
MGVVYEAFDRLLESPVALKALLGSGPEELLDLKREFRSLEDLSHPNLVRLGELFEDRGQRFFSMERVHGETFTRFVRPNGLDLARLQRSLVQLTEGLMALHEAGKVHRDVKPSNTLVETSGRVVLLDFGLLIDTSVAAEHGLAGTPDYMAPEQVWGRVGAAADWYALGVMLYESLTGNLPFRGSAASVLHYKESPQTRQGVRTPLRTLQRDIALIEREHEFEHVASLLRAQRAFLNHDEASAATLLEKAERLFWQSQMGLYACVSAWARSNLGPRDPSHRARAMEWMDAQEIKNPARFVGLLAPVFAPTSGARNQ